jgi:tRNA (guanosine-2'-O-)-methyltransferase
MAEPRVKKIEEYYKNKIQNVEILVDNVWDPHNVAALSRTSDGLGISKINLYYTYNKFPDLKNHGKKSSSSANKWIKYARISDLNAFVSEKKKEGYVFVGADLNAKAERLDNFEFPSKCILVLGAESKGISPEVSKICDKFIFIPMVGMVESYNISVAAGMILYEMFKQLGKNLRLRGEKRERSEPEGENRDD